MAFNSFTQLPREVQLTIWGMACECSPQVRHCREPRDQMLSRPENQHHPEVLAICHDSREVGLKAYKRMFREERHLLPLFNIEVDHLLMGNFNDLLFEAQRLQNTIITSIQVSPQICINRPPLISIEKHLEAQEEVLPFPFKYLKQFVVQDLECSREHRLQNHEERRQCREDLKRYFEEQHEQDPEFMVPEIKIRIPLRGERLCVECQRVDEWAALSATDQTTARVVIVPGKDRLEI